MDLVSDVVQPEKQHEVVGAILFSCGPSFLSRCLLGQAGIFKNRPSPCIVAYRALKSQFLRLQRRANNLAIYNETLKQQQVATRAEVALLGDELHTSRVKLYEGTEQRRKDIAHLKDANDRIEDLLGKLQRYGNFIRILAGINLDNPLYRAALSVLSNAEAEDALVTAIIESAKDKASPWARIIPAVIGPRSPQNYVSALNLTLRTRKDLRERERVCEFWKAMAKMDPENHDVVTPSSSAHSDACDDWDAAMNCEKPSTAEAKCQKSPTVVDDMLECLKNDTFFSSAASLLYRVPQPTFDDMAEWVINAAEEETSTSPPSSVLSGFNEDVHDESDSARRPTALYDALGILKNVDVPTRETKTILNRAVRFEADQDFVSHTSVSDCVILSSTSSILSKVSNHKGDGIDLQPSTTTLDKSEPSDLISDTLAPTSDLDENPYTKDNSIPSVEEIFIVKAGEDIPQLSVQLVMNSPRGYFPLSISDSCIQSSGSEYSEMSALNQEEPASLASINHIDDLSEAFGSIVGHGEIASQSNLEGIDTNIQLGVQFLLTNLDHALMKKKALGPTLSVGATAFSTPTSGKNPSQAFSVKSAPSPPRKLIRHLTDDDNAPRLPFFAARLSQEYRKTPPRIASPSSSLDSLKPPSSPRRNSCISGPSDAVVIVPASRKQSITMSRIAVPSKPIQSSIPRNNLLSPPAKTKRPPLTTPKSVSRRPSPTEPLKSLKLTHIRPKLTPPRADIDKRPALQAIDQNLSSAPEKVNGSTRTSVNHIDGSFKSKAIKPSARDLGKRRGVIMMEKLNLVPATPPSAPKIVKKSTIAPITCQIELHDPPVFSPSISGDMSSNDQPNEANSAVDPNTTPKGNRSRHASVGDSSSELDLASTSLVPKAIDRSIKLSGLESSQGKSTDRSLRTSNLTDKLDVSRFDTQVSELVASMSDSDLDSLEMTEDSEEEDFEDLMVQKEPRDGFSGSLDALPAFCRALMRDTPGTFGNGRLNDNGKENTDNPFEDGLQSNPVASSSSQAQPRRFITQSLISATFGSGHSRYTTFSSSDSFSEQSSDSSFASDSPTHSNSAGKSPIFGLTSHSPRSANTSPRLDNAKIAQLGSPPAAQTSSLPSTGHTKPTSISTRPITPCPPVNRLTPSPEEKLPLERKGSQPILVSKPLKPISSSSNEKPSRLPARCRPAAGPEQDLPPSPIHSGPESSSRMGQSIFRRLSNSGYKHKVNPVASSPAKSSARPYLTPNSNSSFQLKPRSNTINTPSSSPSSTSGSLAPPSPSTKPRSNTVNTYSPIHRSPLSQHVINNSLDSEFQSRSNDPSPESPSTPVQPSTQRVSIQKLAAASRIAQSISKSITPLRVTKKPATISSQPSAARQGGPTPPTAAFMVQNKPIPSGGRRTGSSVAPLIPNCPTSSNGVISPSQCRSMLRTSLSMVR